MARDVGEAASHEAFPAMQSLKGEPRHYVGGGGSRAIAPPPLSVPPNSSLSPLGLDKLLFFFSFLADRERPLVHDSTPGRGGGKEKAPCLPRFSPIPSGPMTHDSICDNPMRQPRSPVTPFKLFLFLFLFLLRKKNIQQLDDNWMKYLEYDIHIVP